MATNPYEPNRAPGHYTQQGSPSRSSQGQAAPGASQNITTLHAGQGARVTTRKNAAQAAEQARVNAEKRFAKRHSSERLTASANRARGGKRGAAAAAQPAQGPERTRKNIFILVGGAFLVLVALVLVVGCVAGLFGGSKEQPAQTNEATDAWSQEEQQVTTSADDSVVYQGMTYTLEKQASGNYGVVRRDAGGSGASSVVFEIEGEPRALILYNSVLVIPENRNGNWDVVSYVIADGSLPAYVMTMDGNEAGGAGSIESAVLDGSNVIVKDSDGNATSVALE